MTQYPEIWNALAEEFRTELVRSRSAGGNRQVRYITARTAMNRLDQVLGFENWEDTYERDPGGSDNILCRLSITLPDGRRITKCDVGSPGNTGDDGEDDKGAVSDAFKRTAVKFGVGRYLYGDGVYRCPSPDRQALPGPAQTPAPAPAPAADAGPPPKRRGVWGNPRPLPEHEPARSNGNGNGKGPTSGRGFFAWLREQEQKHQVGLVKYLNGWAKHQEFPGRVVDWNAEQVELGYAEAIRKLEALELGQAEAYEEAQA